MKPILLVDDDRSLCQMLVEYLGLEGFEVDTAHSGDAGLARALAHDYGVIVLDVMMPGLNGFDTLKALRRDSATPVLMMSARGEELDRILGLEIAAQAVRQHGGRIEAINREGGGFCLRIELPLGEPRP